MNRKVSKAENSQDIAKIGHKARCETEAFINNYISDHAKGWPILVHGGYVSIGYLQEKHFRRRRVS